MKQFMVIIDGPMGSGKTTIGKLVQQKLKRTALIGSDKIKWFVSDFKRTPEDMEMTGKVLQALCEAYVKQGINILIPQGFWMKEYVTPYIKLAKKYKLELFIYQLNAPKDVLIERAMARPKPKEAKTPITKARVIKNLKKWEENRYDAGVMFDTDNMSAEAVAKKILSEVKKGI